jgi:hypothetical protein
MEEAPMSEFFWPSIGFVTGGAVLAIAVWALKDRRWSAGALYVGLGCLAIALLHMVAPFRGSLDPAYVGYSFGFVSLDRGPMVALVAGAVYLLATAAMAIAIRNRNGPAMWLVAAVTGFALFNLGGTLLLTGNRFRIELGEYLQLGPNAAIPVALLVTVLPFAFGLPWSIRKALSEPS